MLRNLWNVHRIELPSVFAARRNDTVRHGVICLPNGNCVRRAHVCDRRRRNRVYAVTTVPRALNRFLRMPTTNNLLVVRSPDIHRAVTFYKAIGMTFDLHSHGNGPQHYACEVDNFVFEIYPEKNGKHTTATRFGFRVDSVDIALQQLASLQVDIVSAASDSEWGRRAVVRDLDGHTVELTSPKCSEIAG